jgi:uncharacterized membrane protein YhaH (DUF805 family)
MRTKAGPVFLEQRTYRRRRMADAARFLPIFGAVLFSVPLLWGQGRGGEASTTGVMLYLFWVWGLLVMLSAVISRRLRDDETQSEQDETHGNTGV